MNKEQADEIVLRHVAIASGIGALPVPAASAAIIAANTAMIAELVALTGTRITLMEVVQAYGFAGAVNIVGRAVFIEVARAMSWGSGQVWGLPLLAAFGAGTAGLQTFVLGRLAVAMLKNGGTIPPNEARAVVQQARGDFEKEQTKRKAA